jgi:hypothetical protein
VGATVATARARLNTLLGAEELRIEHVRRHGRVAVFHHLNEPIILLIEPIDNI